MALTYTHTMAVLALAAGALAQLPPPLPDQVCASGNCPPGTAAIWGWGGHGDWGTELVEGHVPTMKTTKFSSTSYGVVGTTIHPANTPQHHITAMYVVDQDLKILETKTFSKTATSFEIDVTIDVTFVTAFAVVLHCNMHGVWTSMPLVLKKTDCVDVPWPNALPQIVNHGGLKTDDKPFFGNSTGSWPESKALQHMPKDPKVEFGRVSFTVPHPSSASHWIGAVFVKADDSYLACEMYEANNFDNQGGVKADLRYKSRRIRLRSLRAGATYTEHGGRTRLR